MRLAVNLFNLQNARRRVCLLITCSFPCVSYLWGEAAGAQTPDFNCILLQQINLTDGPGAYSSTQTQCQRNCEECKFKEKCGLI